MKEQRDSVRVYLNEIGRIEMLTAEQEIMFGRQIQDLVALEKLRDSKQEKLKKSLTDSEWAELAEIDLKQLRRRLYLGRKAKEKMVQANLRLVVSIAKKYLHRGMDFQDLIQEGTIGLIKAVEKFNPDLGYKFSTYAIHWIKQKITRSISNQSRTIRLPVHVWTKINLIKKVTKDLSQSLGRKPTTAEIANAANMTVEQLKKLKKSIIEPISLEKPVGQEENTALGDLIPTTDEPIEDWLTKKLLVSDLNNVLSTLTEIEAAVLKFRYGLIDNKPRTYQQIADAYNLSRERIRQIESKAFKKLRNPDRSKLLKEYIS